MRKLIITIALLTILASPIMASEVSGNLAARVVRQPEAVMVSDRAEQLKSLLVRLHQLLLQLKDLLEKNAR